MKDKRHCDFYTLESEPTFKLSPGDCSKPVNGRWNPSVCNGVCKSFDDTAYKLKRILDNRVKGEG